MKQKNNTDFRLSLDETLIIKGLAICLMLWYHLFFHPPQCGEFAFQSLAQFGKVCVSLFLFVSAYGLTLQYSKVFDKPITETFKFMIKRFVKFYANYWVVFLIFVPIGIFVFGRSLQDAYGAANPVVPAIFDFLGLQLWRSYNPTWWFNFLIINLYLLFPLLYFFTKKTPVLLLLSSAVILIVSFPLISVDVREFVFHFVLGIAFAMYVDKINRFLNRFNPWLLLSLLIFILVVLFCLRTIYIVPLLRGTRLDGIIALNIVLLVLLVIRNIRIVTPHISRVFVFLGKHSINIYLTHTFVYFLWFSEFIYSFKNPILIFIVLLVICLAISIVLEYGKKVVNLPALVSNVNNKIENKL